MGGAWLGGEKQTAFLRMLPVLEARSVRRLEAASFWMLYLGDLGFKGLPLSYGNVIGAGGGGGGGRVCETHGILRPSSLL